MAKIHKNCNTIWNSRNTQGALGGASESSDEKRMGSRL